MEIVQTNDSEFGQWGLEEQSLNDYVWIGFKRDGRLFLCKKIETTENRET